MLNINTTNLVWSVLESDPAIKKSLSKGLINTTALAKYIIKTTNSNVSMDAVVMSIKRNVQNKNYQDNFPDVNSVLRNTKFLAKTKVDSIILKKDPITFSLLSDVFSCIDYYGGETFRLVNGIETMELIIDDKDLNKILSIYSKDKIIKIRKGIGEISLSFPSAVEHTIGVFATILNELSVHNINIYETITCLSEFLIYVDEKDVSKAYDLLYNLYNKSCNV